MLVRSRWLAGAAGFLLVFASWSGEGAGLSAHCAGAPPGWVPWWCVDVSPVFLSPPYAWCRSSPRLVPVPLCVVPVGRAWPLCSGRPYDHHLTIIANLAGYCAGFGAWRVPRIGTGVFRGATGLLFTGGERVLVLRGGFAESRFQTTPESSG